MPSSKRSPMSRHGTDAEKARTGNEADKKTAPLILKKITDRNDEFFVVLDPNNGRSSRRRREKDATKKMRNLRDQSQIINYQLDPKTSDEESDKTLPSSDATKKNGSSSLAGRNGSRRKGDTLRRSERKPKPNKRIYAEEDSESGSISSSNSDIIPQSKHNGSRSKSATPSKASIIRTPSPSKRRHLHGMDSIQKVLEGQTNTSDTTDNSEIIETIKMEFYSPRSSPKPSPRHSEWESSPRARIPSKYYVDIIPEVELPPDETELKLVAESRRRSERRMAAIEDMLNSVDGNEEMLSDDGISKIENSRQARQESRSKREAETKPSESPSLTWKLKDPRVNRTPTATTPYRGEGESSDERRRELKIRLVKCDSVSPVKIIVRDRADTPESHRSKPRSRPPSNLSMVAEDHDSDAEGEESRTPVRRIVLGNLSCRTAPPAAIVTVRPRRTTPERTYLSLHRAALENSPRTSSRDKSPQKSARESQRSPSVTRSGRGSPQKTPLAESRPESAGAKTHSRSSQRSQTSTAVRTSPTKSSAVDREDRDSLEPTSTVTPGLPSRNHTEPEPTTPRSSARSRKEPASTPVGNSRDASASPPRTPSLRLKREPSTSVAQNGDSCPTTPVSRNRPDAVERSSRRTPATDRTGNAPATPSDRGGPARGTPGTARKSGAFTPSMPQRAGAVVTPSTPMDEARAVLHVSAVPKELLCRELMYEKVRQFLSARLEDQSGGAMYISGVPGTGKTATVRKVIAALHTEHTFQCIEVNGMCMTTPHQLYTQIYEGLTDCRLPWTQALAKLETFFTGKKAKGVVIVVDELDLICNARQDVVYNLLDWPRRAPVVVVTIANTMDLPERLLHGKVASRLGLTRAVFKPYTSGELEQIVASRLLGINAFDKDAVRFVSKKVASVSGDCRRALDICRRATEVAEAATGGEAGGVVTMEHVQAAIDEMMSSFKVKAIKGLSRLEQVFLRAVANSVEAGTEETSFFKVYRDLLPLCTLEGLYAPTVSAAQAACARLCQVRLLISSKRGVHAKILLNCDSDDIHYALAVK